MEAHKGVLVVMPSYNELENLQWMIEETLAAAPEINILVVDDGSPDGTGERASQLARNEPRLFVLQRAEKKGLGPAYLAGFSWAFEEGYRWVCEMDMDGSHRPVDLVRLLEKREDADLVIGSRWVAGGAVVNWPLQRKLISRSGNLFARLMLGSKIRDITAGFRVYRADKLREILEKSGQPAAQGYSFQVELANRMEQAGGRVLEVPITFVERVRGNSKMSGRIVLEALLLVTKWGLQRALGRR